MTGTELRQRWSDIRKLAIHQEWTLIVSSVGWKGNFKMSHAAPLGVFCDRNSLLNEKFNSETSNYFFKEARKWIHCIKEYSWEEGCTAT